MLIEATAVIEIECDSVDISASSIRQALVDEEVTLDLRQNDLLLDIGAKSIVTGHIDEVEVEA